MGSASYKENAVQRFARTKVLPLVERLTFKRLLIAYVVACSPGMCLLAAGGFLNSGSLVLDGAGAVAIPVVLLLTAVYANRQGDRYLFHRMASADQEAIRLHRQLVDGKITADEYEERVEELNESLELNDEPAASSLTREQVKAMKAEARRFGRCSDAQLAQALRDHNLTR